MAKTYTLTRLPQKKDETLNFLSDLNEAQLEAVKSLYGPHLVLAGAGSGKTKTIITRVAYLIAKGIDPRQILLLTFTRRAAMEMLERGKATLDSRCGEVKGGTFHSFAAATLRRYAPLIGLQCNFSILDRGDAESILGLIRGEKDEDRPSNDKKRPRFPKKESIYAMISKAANTQQSVGTVINVEYPKYLWAESEIEKLANRFAEEKLANNMVDYDDLLLFLKKLLAENEEARKEIALANSFVMVDEYQDTNKLQGEILHWLTVDKRNLFVVGDDAQSIYSFRGARFENILEFPTTYLGCRIIKLEANYRSVQPILDLANEVLSQAVARYVKRLYSKRQVGDVTKPIFLRPDSVDEQAIFICQRILELRENGVPLDDIAVLFRSGWHSNELELALAAFDIPFKKYGGVRFIEAAHVKDVVSFLRLVNNVHDALSLNRVLLLHSGVGEVRAAKIAAEVSAKGISGVSIDKLRELILSLMQDEVTVAESTERVLEYYEPLFLNQYDDAEKRADDLESFARIASRYDSLARFLDDLALDPQSTAQDGISSPEGELEEGCVVLSTIHSAKGLEWSEVFILNLIDGQIPSARSVTDTESLEEERRLLYVAITRAANGLYLLSPHLTANLVNYADGSGFSGGFKYAQVSRFFSEMKDFDNLVEKWELSQG
jgi:DNA helicase-2/ATP-dependent DNA helicase PcrA